MNRRLLLVSLALALLGSPFRSHATDTAKKDAKPERTLGLYASGVFLSGRYTPVGGFALAGENESRLNGKSQYCPPGKD